MTDLDSPRRNNDCYFYYYSTCTKGDSCTFRHEPSALGCETMCSFWKEGKCLNVHCNYRHMELRKNRKAIQCYWETQPGGCLKPHCPFLHQNAGQSSTTFNDNTNSIANNTSITEDSGIIEEGAQSPVQNGIEAPSSERNFRSQVDSLVVSFEEESDTESIPTKSPSKHPVKKLRVKTLEEIKLERIQEESAAYFAYSLDHPDNEMGEDLRRNLMRKRKRNLQDDLQNHSKTLRLDTYSGHSGETYLDQNDSSPFSKINNNLSENTNIPSKNQIEDEIVDSQMKSYSILGLRTKGMKKINHKEKKALDTIKIKTLDEIRAEKRRKLAEIKPEPTNVLIEEISSTTKDDEENKKSETVVLKPSPQKKKLKLVRLLSTNLEASKNTIQTKPEKKEENETSRLESDNDNSSNERIRPVDNISQDSEKISVSEETPSVQKSKIQEGDDENEVKSIEEQEEMLLLGDLDYEYDGLMSEIDSILSK